MPSERRWFSRLTISSAAAITQKISATMSARSRSFQALRSSSSLPRYFSSISNGTATAHTRPMMCIVTALPCAFVGAETLACPTDKPPRSRFQEPLRAAAGSLTLRRSSARPEGRAHLRARPVQPEVDVIAMGRGVVDLLLAALRVVARGVGPHALRARVPRRAVPDDLLDAHAASERVQVAVAVRRQQQVDEARGLAAVGAVVHVQVPVDRAALGVEGSAALAPALAAHDPPERPAGVLAEPGHERVRALRRLLAAVLGVVVLVVVDRQPG